MTLDDLLIALANQELKNLATTEENEDTGTFTVRDKHLNGVIGHINSGLLDIFTKFELKIKQIVVTTNPSISNYVLAKKFDKRDATPALTKYIDSDPQDLFDDDIIKIKTIFNQYGYEVPFNDQTCPTSIFQVSHNTLQIPMNTGLKYEVVYQSKHRNIIYNGLKAMDATEEKAAVYVTDMTQLINIHPSLEEPLRLYIKSKVVASRDGGDVGNSLAILQSYNLMLQNLLRSGIVKLDSETGSNKLQDRGFI